MRCLFRELENPMPLVKTEADRTIHAPSVDDGLAIVAKNAVPPFLSVT
jgi:hypothetical protein